MLMFSLVASSAFSPAARIASEKAYFGVSAQPITAANHPAPQFLGALAGAGLAATVAAGVSATGGHAFSFDDHAFLDTLGVAGGAMLPLSLASAWQFYQTSKLAEAAGDEACLIIEDDEYACGELSFDSIDGGMQCVQVLVRGHKGNAMRWVCS